MARRRILHLLPLMMLFASVVACDEFEEQGITSTDDVAPAAALVAGGSFRFEPLNPLTGAAACLDESVPQTEVFQLPDGFEQTILTYEDDIATTNAEVNFDMLTLNETGPQAGRFLYRTHEVGSFAALSVTDLWTNTHSLVAERQDWEAFDGLVWTPWGTILMAEERIDATFPDPRYPAVQRGLIYEYFPRSGEVVPRPNLGARSHEGLRFDRQGNLYGISESRGIANAGQPGESGAIFKFVPERRGNLSKGQLYVLKVRSGRTGMADWVPIDLDPTTFDSDAAAQAVAATGWDRPEDIEIGTIGGQQVMYVAVTEDSPAAQNNGLVLRIRLMDDEAYVSNYVYPGVNVPNESGSDAGTGFDDPDNIALSPNGDLYITEDDSPGDIWVATGKGDVADRVKLFARLLDCGAEPSGIYFSRNGQILYVNSQHANLNNGQDLTVRITRVHGNK